MRREGRLMQSWCYDAAGVAGGFGRVLGPLRGGGDGVMQVGGTKYKVLAHAYMPGTPSIFFLARASHVEPLDPRKGPKTRPNPPATPAASLRRLCSSRPSLLRTHTQRHFIGISKGTKAATQACQCGG